MHVQSRACVHGLALGVKGSGCIAGAPATRRLCRHHRHLATATNVGAGAGIEDNARPQYSMQRSRPAGPRGQRRTAGFQSWHTCACGGLLTVRLTRVDHASQATGGYRTSPVTLHTACTGNKAKHTPRPTMAGQHIRHHVAAAHRGGHALAGFGRVHAMARGKDRVNMARPSPSHS